MKLKKLSLFYTMNERKRENAGRKIDFHFLDWLGSWILVQWF